MRWCRCVRVPAGAARSHLQVSSITLTDSDARHVHLSMPALSLTVIVVGGGYGGCVLAPKLEKAGFDVILIERCQCFFHKIGGGKAAVVPGYETKVTIPLSKLKVSKVLWAEAIELDVQRKTLTVRHGAGLISILPRLSCGCCWTVSRLWPA